MDPQGRFIGLPGQQETHQAPGPSQPPIMDEFEAAIRLGNTDIMQYVESAVAGECHYSGQQTDVGDLAPTPPPTSTKGKGRGNLIEYNASDSSMI